MIRVLVALLLIAGLAVAPVLADDPPPEPEGPSWFASLLSQLLLNPITAPVAAPLYAIGGAWAYENQEQAVELIQTVVDTSGESTNSILDIINIFAEQTTGFFGSIMRFIRDAIDAAIAVGRLILMAIDVLVALIGRIWDYMGQIVGLFWTILTTLSDAPPQQIPGLPRCVSAPQQYQVCAVWYVIDWTLIADGTPGAAIVPILTTVMVLGIAFYVIRSGWRMITWFSTQLLGDG